MDLPHVGAGLATFAICALLAWLAYLGVCVFIVLRTNRTDGLRDLGAAARDFRRFGSRPPKEPTDNPPEIEHAPP